MTKSADTVVHQNKQFTNVDYTEKRLVKREFIACNFIACDFTKSDLRDNDFESCHFERCNFSMAIIDGAGFRDVNFTGCKILGVDFARCNQFMFSFSFSQCILDYSTFFGTKLKKTVFEDCSMKEVNFSEVDLTESVFNNCDLTGARFLNRTLTKTDFRTARNFNIDPDTNKMKKAKFSALNLEGLLYKHQLDID